jgi:hypothetical protein
MICDSMKNKMRHKVRLRREGSEGSEGLAAFCSLFLVEVHVAASDSMAVQAPSSSTFLINF